MCGTQEKNKVRHCVLNTRDRERKGESQTVTTLVSEKILLGHLEERKEHKAAVCFISGRSKLLVSTYFMSANTSVPYSGSKHYSTDCK